MPLGMHAAPIADPAAAEQRGAQAGGGRWTAGAGPALPLPPSAASSGGGAFGYTDSELERRIADELAAIDFGAAPGLTLTLNLTLAL